MPIYEYECLSCGERFEIRRTLAEGPRDARCPDCDSGDLRRRYSSVAVVHGGRGGPTYAPGELRPVDPGRLTSKVARSYAASTGDKAMSEVARQVDAGAGPAELKEFVRGVKAERQAGHGKSREKT
jgi:putative FmdB family regulatory protein